MILHLLNGIEYKASEPFVSDRPVVALDVIPKAPDADAWGL